MKSIFTYIAISVLIHVFLFYYIFHSQNEETLTPESNEILIERNSTPTQNKARFKETKPGLDTQKNEAQSNLSEGTPTQGSVTEQSEENIVDFLLKSNPTPIYPHVSRLKNEEGRVVLKVKLNSDKKLEIRIDRSSGYKNLDLAAIDAVKKWKIPTNLEEKLTSKEIEIPFLFKLHD